MPQVSKYPLSKEIEVRMKELLDDGLASLENKEDIGTFLSDFLTPTEKIMFAKRLAIALLLKEGFAYREIARTLKVSTSTISVAINWQKLRGAGYEKVIDNLSSQEKWKPIFELIHRYNIDPLP